ncbi:MAG: AtpZ/AtpI family protein [Faecalibacterium sp.]|jgi:hypothetical protein|nr:AtpZ/AtpI family protein [Faecalibacterium sp.]
MDSWMKALGNIVWLTQLGLSILLPPVICLWGCAWLVNSRGAPAWLYVPALVLGLGAGAQNFWKFAKMMMKKAEKQNGPTARFNRHS